MNIALANVTWKGKALTLFTNYTARKQNVGFEVTNAASIQKIKHFNINHLSNINHFKGFLFKNQIQLP